MWAKCPDGRNFESGTFISWEALAANPIWEARQEREKISADAISVPIWNPMKKARTEEPSREMQKEL